MSNELIKLTATEQAALFRQGKVSSVELTQAFLSRITEANPRLNAYTEVFYTEAMQQAKAMDAEWKAGRLRGPLHGLPISIKECFDMEGKHTSLGVVTERQTRAARDSVMVQAVKSAGAVILGRTNVSQLMLFHESSNPVYGQTNNAFSLERTPGGSSGGEASAIAAGMSPFGLGTDIGGSIRIPAHFSGICGIKLTQDRWSMTGVSGGIPGQESIRSAPGPMARTTADLRLMLQGLDSRFLATIDSKIPPLSYESTDTVPTRTLRVGYLVNDGLMSPSAAVQRAVHEAVDALRAQGVEVVPFVIPNGYSPMSDYLAIMTADGGDTVRERIDSGAMDPVLRSSLNTVKMPSWLKATIGTLTNLTGDPTVGALLYPVGEKSVAQLWKLTKKIRDYREYFVAAMDAAQLDALICPPHNTPALPHGAAKNFAPAGYFSMLFNLIQLPAGVVPVTTVRNEEVARQNISGRLNAMAANVDQGSAGLPVGVQVVARPWQESLLMVLMEMIEQQASHSAAFPMTPTGAFA